VTDEYHNTTTNNIIRQADRSDLTVIDVNIVSCAIIKENVKEGFLPDKMLYNIGLDAASTNLVCVSPSTVVFERSDAAMFEGQLALTEIKERRRSEDKEEVERKGEEEVQKQKQRERERQRQGQRGDEEVEEEGDYTPRALIVPVYHTSTHQHNKNITNALKTLRSQSLKDGINSTQLEAESPSELRLQTAAETVTVPMPVLSSAAPHSAPLPFPSITTQCGEQQSTKLLKAYKGTPDQPSLVDPGGLEKVSFNAQVIPLSSLLLSYKF
jgi:hypothetical protein